MSAPARPGLVAEIDALFRGQWPGRLRELFDHRNPKPLAIGIDEQIVEALGLTSDEHRRLGRLLAPWTGRSAYLQALVTPGAMRYGIGGEPVEPVGEGGVEAAKARRQWRDKLARRQAEQERRATRARNQSARPRRRPGSRRPGISSSSRKRAASARTPRFRPCGLGPGDERHHDRT
jgi:sRNA-binding protein